MKETSLSKRILSICFVIFIVICFIINSSWNDNLYISDYIASKKTNTSSGDWSILEKNYTDRLLIKNNLINVNGFLSKLVGLKDYYSGKGVLVSDDGYIVSAYPITSTDYEYEQTVAFYNVLKEHGINLLYINEPAKYLNDSDIEEQFGLESYTNRNTDLFLSRVRKAGIPVVDLREELVTDNLNIKDMFYRTDHHWTVPTGLWASEKIAEGLNDYCGYNIDLSIYDKNNYTFTQYDNCWIGEQGNLVGESYVGRDNYTLIEPNFETSYSMTIDGKEYEEESFERFIDYDLLSSDNVNKKSRHYAYRQYDTVNHNIKNGKVLMLTDSYDAVTVPFVSLGVNKLNWLIRRDYEYNFDLLGYILANNYDTVIISYAQFMIGAHDSPDSVNFHMFTFLQD